jgi:hypothetical protein
LVRITDLGSKASVVLSSGLSLMMAGMWYHIISGARVTYLRDLRKGCRIMLYFFRNLLRNIPVIIVLQLIRSLLIHANMPGMNIIPKAIVWK